MSINQDNLYASPIASLSSFKFDQSVVNVFPDLRFEDTLQQASQTDIDHSFKKAQGYSDLEISQKPSARENVLLTKTFSTHQQRLKNTGFSSAEVWFQYFNFASMIALK